MKRRATFPGLPRLLLGLLAVLLAGAVARAQYGPVAVSTASPVNRAMGGVATAAPVSASGAMLWNPATLPGLGQSQLEFGVGLLFPQTRLTSSVGASARGPGIPPIGLSGTQSSDSTLFALPAIGLAYLPEGSPVTYGLGINAVAGFGVDYAGNPTNPLLSPPHPAGIGVGPIYSQYQVLQFTLAAAYQVTDRLSVAAGPVMDLATLQVNPAIFAAPDDANGDGFATFPSAMHGRTTLGAGFIVGLYYRLDNWAVGASYKSPQWFDRFRFNSTDELGRPRSLKFGLDLPGIVSVGAAYTGWERLVLAADARYLDFRDATGFGTRGINPDGSIRGLGWNSVFAIAVGAQYQWTDSLTVRLGYTWGNNPIPDSQAGINAASPSIDEHSLSAGASWKVTDSFLLSFAYAHVFENSIDGPLLSAFGPVPRTSVRTSAAIDAIHFGATVLFGGPRRHAVPCPSCEVEAANQ
jgi:long-chain fatty acid transport protein